MAEHLPERDDDRALLRALQEAVDPDGPFQELFRRFHRRVHGFFHRRGFDTESCRELSQETFLRVYRGAGSFRGEIPLPSWIFQIAANVYRNELRRLQAEKRSGEERSLDDSSTPELAEQLPDSGEHALAQPLARVLHREQVAALHAALYELPAQMRRAMQMRVHHGYEIPQIAAVMQVAESTVKVHLHQARRKLRQSLAERFGELPF